MQTSGAVSITCSVTLGLTLPSTPGTVLCTRLLTTEKPHRMIPMGLCLSLFVLFTSVGTHATWTKPDQTTEP